MVLIKEAARQSNSDTSTWFQHLRIVHRIWPLCISASCFQRVVQQRQLKLISIFTFDSAELKAIKLKLLTSEVSAVLPRHSPPEAPAALRARKSFGWFLHAKWRTNSRQPKKFPSDHLLLAKAMKQHWTCIQSDMKVLDPWVSEVLSVCSVLVRLRSRK